LGITVVVVAGISITMALTIFSGVRIASVFSVLTLIARWITITGEPARLVVAVIVSMLRATLARARLSMIRMKWAWEPCRA
jgi:hypothetical protein